MKPKILVSTGLHRRQSAAKRPNTSGRRWTRVDGAVAPRADSRGVRCRLPSSCQRNRWTRPVAPARSSRVAFRSRRCDRDRTTHAPPDCRAARGRCSGSRVTIAGIALMRDPLGTSRTWVELVAKRGRHEKDSSGGTEGTGMAARILIAAIRSSLGTARSFSPITGGARRASAASEGALERVSFTMLADEAASAPVWIAPGLLGHAGARRPPQHGSGASTWKRLAAAARDHRHAVVSARFRQTQAAAGTVSSTSSAAGARSVARCLHSSHALGRQWFDVETSRARQHRGDRRTISRKITKHGRSVRAGRKSGVAPGRFLDI